MAYKDKAVQNKVSHEYGKRTYYTFSVRVRKDDAVYTALFKMQDRAGTPFATYALTALREKLIADGYMAEK